VSEGPRRDWAVCTFWVDDGTGVGSHQQLERVVWMFNQKYGISGEGEMRWTLGLGVARDRNTHTISPLQEGYINNLVERPQLQNATTVTIAGTRRDPHQGSMLNDALGTARHVWQHVLGTNQLPSVRRIRCTTGHQRHHQQTRPITSQPRSGSSARSPTRLTMSQARQNEPSISEETSRTWLYSRTQIG